MEAAGGWVGVGVQMMDTMSSSTVSPVKNDNTEIYLATVIIYVSEARWLEVRGFVSGFLPMCCLPWEQPEVSGTWRYLPKRHLGTW